MIAQKTEQVNETESVIILAAGSSSRLGQSKQLVEVDGVPLLLKSTLTALDASYTNVVVVLGAHAAQHKKTIAHLPIEIMTNTEWERGMGSSLKTGLEHVIKSRPKTSTVVVMVCDQPLLTSAHLAALRDVHKNTLSQIVASRYGNTLGVPALFDRTLFSEMLNIKDAQGAKAIIESHSESVSTIDWEAGHLDIDTPEDLNLLDSFKG
jgi:molybdenum cofactor cytidylyltransferase